MKVLYLGDPSSSLIPWLKAFGDEVTVFTERLEPNSELLRSHDFLISYNYRYIISGAVLSHFPYAAVNLHISLLPWNRGADPNIWSFLRNTPKGVTIHYIDVGLDTGEIIYQREVAFGDPSKDTLKSTYEKLHQELRELFQDHWVEIRSKTCPRQRQPAHYGTQQKMKEKTLLMESLGAGWDATIEAVEQAGLEKRLRIRR